MSPLLVVDPERRLPRGRRLETEVSALPDTPEGPDRVVDVR